MKLIFARNNHWISRVVRVRTGCEWSHVGIVDGDNVIEARGHVGVVLTPIHKFIRRYEKTEFRYLPGDVQKAKNLIGLPFDMRGLWGHLFFIPSIHDKEAWFCSEIVALAAHDIDDNKAHRFRPDHIYHMATIE